MYNKRMLIMILAVVAVVAVVTRLPMRSAETAPTAATTRATSVPAPETDLPEPTSTLTVTPDDMATTSAPSVQVERPVIPAGSGERMDITGVDTSSADAVADAVAGQASSADVRTDTSWADGARRAVPLMTEELAKSVSAEIPGGRDALWLDLEAHDGYTEVQVKAGEDSGTPPDTATQALRIRIATVTMVGRDGWEGATQTTAYYLTMTMTEGGWRVSEMTASTYTDS